MQLGVPMTIAQANCGHRDENTHSQRQFSVMAFDASAGQTYVVGGNPSATLYDANGNTADLPGAGLSVAASGRYYLVVLGPGPVTLTVTQAP